MLHGSETWPVRKENVVALQRAEMRMVRWTHMLKLQHMQSLYEVKCNGYWRAAISTSKSNSSELWKMLQGVLGEMNGEVSEAHTADDFATFFQNKVDSVRSTTATTSLYDVPCHATPMIRVLAPVMAEEAERMIGSSPNKSCQLDPAPTLHGL